MTKKINKQDNSVLSLDFGDYNTVARMAGTTREYVSQVLNNGRSRGSKTGKRIVASVSALQQTKENLVALATTNGDEFSNTKNYMIPVNQPLKTA